MVLLNVARHDTFAPNVAESPDAADTLVDLMQMFRDKASIFCSSTELLARIVAASESVKVRKTKTLPYMTAAMSVSPYETLLLIGSAVCNFGAKGFSR